MGSFLIPSLLALWLSAVTGAPSNLVHLFPLNSKCSSLTSDPTPVNRNKSCIVNCFMFNKDGGYCDEDDNCMCFVGTRITIISPIPPKCSEMESTYIKDEELNCYMACAVSGYYGGICKQDFCLCLETKKAGMKIDLRRTSSCSDLQEVNRRACSLKCAVQKTVGGFCSKEDDKCRCLFQDRKDALPVKHGDYVSLVSSDGVRRDVEVTQLLLKNQTARCSALPSIVPEMSGKKELCSMFCAKYDFQGGFCNPEDQCLCIKQRKDKVEVSNRIEAEDAITTTEVTPEDESSSVFDYLYWQTEDEEIAGETTTAIIE